jgi:putative ABC transport system substrate-binding protein
MVHRGLLLTRRDALLALVVALGIVPAGRVIAHDSADLPTVGILSVREGLGPRFVSFRQGLRELGYEINRNVAIESRFAGGEALLPQLAQDLVRRNVNMFVTVGEPATRAAAQVTRTIPIVFVGVYDPVATGLVASLASPGGNITGLAVPSDELSTKRLELLKEALPAVSRIAMLRHPADRAAATLWRATRDAATSLGLKVEAFEVAAPEALERAFSEMKRWGAEALVVLPGAMLEPQRGRIAELAVTNRLPTMWSIADEVEAGGLMGYHPDDHELFRRAASYTDRILKGARPGQLPVERPTKFDLAINLKTAAALGISIPPSLLQRAECVTR